MESNSTLYTFHSRFHRDLRVVVLGFFLHLQILVDDDYCHDLRKDYAFTSLQRKEAIPKSSFPVMVA